MRKLTIADIADLRAYERERAELRARIVDLKRRRRFSLGDLLTITFENTDTMRFQVQEMARAERMLTDAAIEHEVATYNELIPDPGELSGTLFVELTSDELLREWLPKLIGIQRCLRFEVGAASDAVPAIPEDEERLTREDITTTVHYLKFRFTPEQQAVFVDPAGIVRIVVDHPEYRAAVELTDEQRRELARDFSDDDRDDDSANEQE
jgi:hypothetical protein